MYKDFKNVLNCEKRQDFHYWLKNNHQIEHECWLNLNIKSKKIENDNSLNYIDAVYIALCFGWIDSIVRKIDNHLFLRFSPRRKNSLWTELNKERCRWLISHNYMEKKGYSILPNLNEPFKIDLDILEFLQSDLDIWNNFNNFHDLYKRVRIGNIQRNRRRVDIFNRMLNNFKKKTKNNKMYGEWNDYGRLL